MFSTTIFLTVLLWDGASGHAAMYEPPTRNSRGLQIMGPSCPAGACLFFTEGTGIGCPNVSGARSYIQELLGCGGHGKPAKPTIHFHDEEKGTYNLRRHFPLTHPMTWIDWSKTHPWRYPGSSPVLDPCGIAAGWFHDGNPLSGGRPPFGIPAGTFGSSLPKLMQETVWIAGASAEVAFALQANHGGGYQYRLCPADEELSEECFQRHPLDYVSDDQWLQYGPDGLDTNNRTRIKAVRVTTGVMPNGSVWTRNPIPACGDSFRGGSCDNFRMRPLHCTREGQFPPPVKGAHGFGGAACTLEQRALKHHKRCTCTPDEFKQKSLQFGIVDKVKVPSKPGKYVLSWRWDTEQSPQVWGQCADVTIVQAGTREATVPFQRHSGCDICCPASLGACSNCTKCLDDQTGDCEYCWKPLPGFHPVHVPRAQCLGHEDKDGGAPLWFPGDEGTLWSPGCSKCWAEGACGADRTMVV